MIRIMIDNNDGAGYRDYSSDVLYSDGATLIRHLNKPSKMQCTVVVEDSNDVPKVGASVCMMDALGNYLFEGKIFDSPIPRSLGSGIADIVEGLRVTAYTPDAALSSAPCQFGARLFDISGQMAWSTLLNACVGPESKIVVSGQSAGCGRFTVHAGSSWITAADALAAATLSTYRLSGNQFFITPYGHSIHNASLLEPGVVVEPLAADKYPLYAKNIITVGQSEPASYVHEIYEADGSTSSFILSQSMFEENARQKASFRDAFQGSAVDLRKWVVDDTASHISITSSGIICSGGTGKDAESVICSRTALELGGCISIVADGIKVAPGSTGQILGLYTSSVAAESCFTAFQISTAKDIVNVQPIANGTLCGTALSLDPSHSYTFRIRVSSMELQRVSQSFAYVSSGSPMAYGGDIICAGAKLSLEVEDATSGSSTSTISLFSGVISSAPAHCVLGIYNNINMRCSLKSIQYEQSAPLEVSIMNPGDGGFSEQSIGLITSGAVCHITSSGELVYYPGYVPPAKAIVRVMYRARQIATACVASGAGDENALGSFSYLGVIRAPVASTSVDCLNAARSIVSCLQDQAPIVSGTYTKDIICSDEANVWPGDLFNFSSATSNLQSRGLVNEVKVELFGSEPQHMRLHVSFAEDWHMMSGIIVDSAIPADFEVPQAASESRSITLNLGGLAVTGLSSDSIEIDTGTEAPVGGGFEVRSRDHNFGAGSDSDLVLRANTRQFSLPRQSASEAYYISMFDNSSPSVYSAAAVNVNVSVPL